MNTQTAVFDTGLVYFENFEDGDFANWGDGAGAGVNQVTPLTAANGTGFSYRETGSAVGHFDGIFQTLGNVRLRYASFWIRSADPNLNDAYFTLRDTAGNEVIWFFASSLGGIDFCGSFEAAMRAACSPQEACCIEIDF